MNLKQLQTNWHKFGKRDPLWAVLTWPEKKDSKWKLDEFFQTGAEEVEAVMKDAEALGIHISRGKALDFGCGVGRLTQAMANFFDEVCGVDIAPSMVKLAKKYNHHGARCKYYLNERDDLRLFTNNSFDFIYTNIVLQHMLPAYAKSYIKEFLRVLNPSGLLIFQLPSDKLEQPVRQSEPEVAQPEKGYQVAQRIIKKFIKLLTPSLILRWYAKIKYQDKAPVMEMHCVRKEDVVTFLKENGGQILDIKESSMGKFTSVRYVVKKSQ